MADKFKIAGSNTGDYYQIVNGKRQYFKKDGTPMEESVFLQNNNAQIAKDGSMRKKENVAKDGLVKHYIKGSKSGRYYTVDKNGNKNYYAADGTPINETYFLQKEGITKNSKGELVKVNKKKVANPKAQAPAQQQEEVGFFEGLWESTKGAVKGAGKIAKNLITDEQGNYSLNPVKIAKNAGKKLWKATKNVFRDETGKVSLRGAWQAIKSAGKGVWNAGVDMVKGMFANKDGSFTVGSVLKGVGVLAAFGVGIWLAAPVLAAAAGISAISAGAIIGLTLAAPLIIEGVNQAFEGGNKILDSASETDLAKASAMAKDGLQTQSKGVTNVVIGETMRRGMKKGASHHVKSYEANLAKTSAKGKSFGSKTEFKVRTRSKALLKTYADGVKSTAQVVRHPVKTTKGVGKAIANQWDRVVVRSTRKGFSERIKKASPEELRNIYEEIAQDEVMSPKSKARAMKEVADKADMQADLGVEGMEDFASSVRDQIHTKKYTQLETEIDNIGTRTKFFTRRKVARTRVPESKVEKINNKIDKAVEKGQITEGQADALRTALEEQVDGIQSYAEVKAKISDKKNPIQLDEDLDAEISNIKTPKQRDELMNKLKKADLTPQEKMTVYQRLLDTCKTEADILEFNFRVRAHKSGLSLKEQRALQRIAYQKLQGMNPKKYGKIDGLAQMVRDDAKAMKKAADNNVDVVENKSGKKHWWSKKRDVSPIEKANAKYAQEYANQHLAEVTEAAQAEKVGQFRTQMEEGKGLKKLDKKIEKAYENNEITEAQRDVLLDELPKAKENAKCKKNAEKLEKKIKKTKDIEATRQEIETAKNNGEITDEQFAELNEKLAKRQEKLAPKKRAEVREESAEDGLEITSKDIWKVMESEKFPKKLKSQKTVDKVEFSAKIDENNLVDSYTFEGKEYKWNGNAYAAQDGSVLIQSQARNGLKYRVENNGVETARFETINGNEGELVTSHTKIEYVDGKRVETTVDWDGDTQITRYNTDGSYSEAYYTKKGKLESMREYDEFDNLKKVYVAKTKDTIHYGIDDAGRNIETVYDKNGHVKQVETDYETANIIGYVIRDAKGNLKTPMSRSNYWQMIEDAKANNDLAALSQIEALIKEHDQAFGTVKDNYLSAQDRMITGLKNAANENTTYIRKYANKADRAEMLAEIQKAREFINNVEGGEPQVTGGAQGGGTIIIGGGGRPVEGGTIVPALEESSAPRVVRQGEADASTRSEVIANDREPAYDTQSITTEEFKAEVETKPLEKTVIKTTEVKVSETNVISNSGDAVPESITVDGKTYKLDDKYHNTRYITEDGSFIERVKNPDDTVSLEVTQIGGASKLAGGEILPDKTIRLGKDNAVESVETYQTVFSDEATGTYTTRTWTHNAKGEVTGIDKVTYDAKTDKPVSVINETADGKVMRKFANDGETVIESVETNAQGSVTEHYTVGEDVVTRDNYLYAEDGVTLDSHSRTTEWNVYMPDSGFGVGKVTYKTVNGKTQSVDIEFYNDNPSVVEYRAIMEKCLDEPSLDLLADAVSDKGTNWNPLNWKENYQRSQLLKDIEAKKQKLNSVDMSDVKLENDLLAQDPVAEGLARIDRLTSKEDVQALMDKCTTPYEYMAIRNKLSALKKDTLKRLSDSDINALCLESKIRGQECFCGFKRVFNDNGNVVKIEANGKTFELKDGKYVADDNSTFELNEDISKIYDSHGRITNKYFDTLKVEYTYSGNNLTQIKTKGFEQNFTYSDDVRTGGSVRYTEDNGGFKAGDVVEFTLKKDGTLKTVKINGQDIPVREDGTFILDTEHSYFKTRKYEVSDGGAYALKPNETTETTNVKRPEQRVNNEVNEKPAKPTAEGTSQIGTGKLKMENEAPEAGQAVPDATKAEPAQPVESVKPAQPARQYTQDDISIGYTIDGHHNIQNLPFVMEARPFLESTTPRDASFGNARYKYSLVKCADGVQRTYIIQEFPSDFKGLHRRGSDNFAIAIKGEIPMQKAIAIREVIKDVIKKEDLTNLNARVQEILNRPEPAPAQKPTPKAAGQAVPDATGVKPAQPAQSATKSARQYTTDDIRIGKTSGQFGGNTTVFNPDNGMLLDIRPNGRGGFDSSANVTNWSQYGEYVTFMEKGEVRTAIIQDLGETPLGKTMSGVRGGDNITVAVKDKISIAKCKRIKQVMEDIKTEAELETLPQKVNEILNDNSTTTKQIKVGDTTYDYVVDSDGCLVKIGNDEVPFKKDNIPSFKIEGDEYTEYSFENGEIKIIKTEVGQAVPEATKAEPTQPAQPAQPKTQTKTVEVEDPALVQANFAKDVEAIQHETSLRKLIDLEAKIDTDPAFEKYSDVQKQSLKNEIEHRKQEIKSIQDGMLNEEFKTRIKDVQDVSEYDAIREDILNSELSDTNKADLLRILEDDKNTRFPQRVVDDEAPVVEDEAIEDAPVEETFTPEELTGVEKIKNDEFNAVKKSIDDVVDNESYTAARERIEKSSILTDAEKSGMMAMLDEAKGNFKPVTPSPVTPKTFGQKVGSARRATLGTLGFVAGAGVISSRLGAGDDSDKVTDESIDETQEVVDNTVSDEVVTPVAADETEVTEEPETTAPVTENDINGAETEEALDGLAQRINDDTTMSQEDKDKLLALINARKEALKGNDGSEQAVDEVKSNDDHRAQQQDQSIGNGKYTVIKGNGGHHVVKDQDGKVIPVRQDGTVVIDGKKYQVKPDGKLEEVKEQDKGSVEFKKDTYKDRIQGQKDEKGNKPEITHSQVVEFTKAIQNAKTKEDLDNILADIFTFKMFKGRKQLRTAIRAKRDAIKHSDDEKLVAKKNEKIEKKSKRAIERNIDERKSFLGIRLGKKDKEAIDAEMKKLLSDYDKKHKDIEG